MSEDFSSIAKCSVCGNPVSECTCTPEQRKHADRTIEIVHKHVGTPQKPVNSDAEKELQILREELEEKNQIIALQAQKEFEDEKSEIVNQFPESRREEIETFIGDDVDRLEQLKTQLAIAPIVKDSNSGRKPSGKATLPNAQDNNSVISSGKDAYQEYIDSLFKEAKFGATEEIKANAERKIEELYESYHEGFKNRDVNRNLPRQTRYVMTQCLKCGSMLTGQDAELYASRKIACPYCGFKGGFVKHPQGQTKYF